MQKERIFGTLITEKAERVRQQVNTLLPVFLPPVGKKARKVGEDDFRKNFRVLPENEAHAKAIAKQAWIKHKAGDVTAADILVRSLYAYHVSMSDDPMHLWNHAAAMLSDEIGINSRDKEIVRNVISSLVTKGKALEAFAGFNSFIKPRPGLKIVATDYCEQALMRYPYPNRKRVLFDLNQLNGANKIGNFYNNSFNAVTVCAGYKYPRVLRYIFEEFFRILAPGGRLIMVEHEYAGSSLFMKRDFNEQSCTRVLKRAGFSAVSITPLEVERENAGIYYLVIASK